MNRLVFGPALQNLFGINVMDLQASVGLGNKTGQPCAVGTLWQICSLSISVISLYKCQWSAGKRLSWRNIWVNKSSAFRSLVLPIKSCVLGWYAASASRIWWTSEHVTPPTTNSTNSGWSFGRGLLTFMNKLNPVLIKSFNPCDLNSISGSSGESGLNTPSMICFTRGW